MDALNNLDNAVKHGAIIPDKVRVVTVSGLELEGRYLELVKIVESILKEETQTH